MFNQRDTIVAVSTPPGYGGIGVVRLSGPEARGIGERLVRFGKRDGLRPGRLTHGWVIDPADGSRVDEVLAAFQPAPHTYTGQDVLEIQAHGSPLVLSRIVELCQAAGARLAEPGEFTARAFLSGRIDLAQAEAVAELIAARTIGQAQLAAEQLAGGLSAPLRDIADLAVDLLAEVEVGLDFPDEGVTPAAGHDLGRRIRKGLLDPLDRLVDQGRSARLVREGLRVVLAGRPNVGKSSLLNALCGRPRALVHPEPGTTRDYLEELLDLQGLPVLLTDTAGLWPGHGGTAGPEAAGMALTRRLLGQARLVLLVVDASAGLGPEDEALAEPGRPNLLAVNKADLVPAATAEALARRLTGIKGVVVSAKTGQGLAELKAALGRELLAEAPQMSELRCLPNLRQTEALAQAGKAFGRAGEGLRRSEPPELIAFELKEGLDALGRILGQTTPEEVLDSIFSRFCLGK